MLGAMLGLLSGGPGIPAETVRLLPGDVGAFPGPAAGRGDGGGATCKVKPFSSLMLTDDINRLEEVFCGVAIVDCGLCGKLCLWLTTATGTVAGRESVPLREAPRIDAGSAGNGVCAGVDATVEGVSIRGAVPGLSLVLLLGEPGTEP